MKVLRLSLAIACLVGIVGTSFAQNVGNRKPQGILGVLDPRTGVFHTLPSVADSADAQPLIATTGKFVVNFTITVAATIASTAKIACVVNASTADAASGNFVQEEAAALATRSGSTATCTVNIPYSWNLSSASIDKVTLTYSIEAPVEATATTAFPQRMSTQSLATIAVPTSGTTTTETVTATF